MCFGLYAARDAHAMRHYDVKLLNFLLADFAAACVSATPSRPEDEAAATVLFSPNSAAAAAMAAGRVVGGGGRKQQLQQDGVMTVRYGLGPHVYRLEMPAEQVRRRGFWGCLHALLCAARLVCMVHTHTLTDLIDSFDSSSNRRCA